VSFLAAVADERVSGVKFSDDALSVSLRDGRIITVPLVWYPRLLDATRAQRENWKVAGGGYGIHWPDLDEDLSTEGLLSGAPAPKGSAGAHRGRSAGKSVSASGLEESEKRAILDAIAKVNGDKQLAARLLGIGKTTLYRRLRQYAEQGKTL